MRRIAIIVACLAGLQLFTQADARQKGAMPRGADVLPAATVSASPVVFDSIIPGNSANGIGSITVTATEGLPFKIGLDNGQNRVGSDRAMKSLSGSPYLIPYFLYADAGYSIPWGDDGASNRSLPVARIGNGANDTVTVYAKMKTDRLTPVGTYTDTVLITITY